MGVEVLCNAAADELQFNYFFLLEMGENIGNKIQTLKGENGKLWKCLLKPRVTLGLEQGAAPDKSHPPCPSPRHEVPTKPTGARLGHIELYFNPVRKVQELHQKILQSLLPTDKKYTTKL